MAYDADPSNPDLAALKARQAGLRAFMEDMAECVMAQQLPETFLEAERSVRAITTADRFLQRVPPDDLPDAPQPGASPVRDRFRLRLRGYGDKVMAAVLLIPKPASFLGCERAGRYAWNADRMLVQLYMPPKAARPSNGGWDDDDDAIDDTPEGRLALATEIMAKLDDVTGRYARRYGFWPDGATYEEGEDDPEAHIYGYAPEPEGEPPEQLDDNALPEFIVHRINAMAWHHACHHGHWPDGSPFSESDPPFVHLSANFGDRQRRAPGEIREGNLWWIVRKPRDAGTLPAPP